MMSENRASIRQGLLPDKICSTHRDRLAIVYIRQSTPQQIERHQESTRLQYALVECAVHFGWPRERVVVIDDDLGRTGKTIEGRLGFQRLVAEVSLGNVGLVLGIEMSRLARSCRDWHQLLEICPGDLHGDPPAHRLPFPLQPCLYSLAVEGSGAVGLLVKPQQAARSRVVDLQL